MNISRLWISIFLITLSAYLVLQTYQYLTASTQLPLLIIQSNGTIKNMGYVTVFRDNNLINEILINAILTPILSAIASVVLYSSISKPRIRTLRVRRTMDMNNLLRIGLSMNEARAVSIIMREGGVLTQSRLAKEMGLSKYQASRLVRRLESKGIVEKRRIGITNLIILRFNDESNLFQP